MKLWLNYITRSQTVEKDGIYDNFSCTLQTCRENWYHIIWKMVHTSSFKYSKNWFIRYWMIQKALLTENLWGFMTWHSFTYWQHPTRCSKCWKSLRISLSGCQVVYDYQLLPSFAYCILVKVTCTVSVCMPNVYWFWVGVPEYARATSQPNSKLLKQLTFQRRNYFFNFSTLCI